MSRKTESRPGQKIKLITYDELCGGSELGTDESVLVKTEELHDFPNHPFSVKDDEQMEELVKSIKQRGILNALIVRADPVGGYQVLSGHRRKHAAERLNIEKVPAMIVDVDDDSAVLIMVDSNIQRTNISPGDRARSMKMKYDSLLHKGEASDKLSNEAVGELYGMSGRQVQRYLRLNELIPEWLEEVDNKNIQMVIGVELSFLEEDIQKYIFEEYSSGIRINKDKIKQIRSLTQISDVTADDISDILNASTNATRREVMISGNKLRRYFPPGYSNKDMKEVIFRLLEEWSHTNR